MTVPSASSLQYSLDSEGIIDFHSHWISPTELRLLSARSKVPRIGNFGNGFRVLHPAADATGYASQPFPVWDRAMDIPGRLRHLDENKVKHQVLSYVVPYGYDGSLTAEEIKPLFRGFNNDLAELVQKHPDRFLGLAALPTSDIGWASEELDRAHRELGFIGCTLPLNAFASLRGAQVLTPIFKVAQKHSSHILVHRGAASESIPGQPLILPREDTEWARGCLVSDSQLAAGAITLGLTDFLNSYPDVTIQIAMLGGAIPYVIEHIQQSARRAGITVEPTEGFRRLYFDPGPYSTAPRSLVEAVRAFGADRILFGSDYGPAASIAPAVSTLEADLTTYERSLIYFENGKKLLAKKGITV